jgi:hypothetical protein
LCLSDIAGAIAIIIGIALTISPTLNGLAIARDCIAQEAEEKAGFLDLGAAGTDGTAGRVVLR